MLNQKSMEEITQTLPKNIPHVFISSVTGFGISTLKDVLWEKLNKENNIPHIVIHRPKDSDRLQEEILNSPPILTNLE
jgi:GTP-binding protein